MPRPLPGSDYFIGKGLPGENVGIDDDPSRVYVSGSHFTAAEEALLRQLLAHYTRQLEQGTPALSAAISAHLALPALRAFWPGSSLDHAGTLYDISGQNRHLASAGSQPPSPSTYRRTATVTLSRRDSASLSRADEPALNPPEISFGLWLRLSPAALPATIIGKMAAPDYAYAIALHAHSSTSAAFRFYHSPDGADLHYNHVTTPEHAAWHHLVATVRPVYGPALYLDGVPHLNPSGFTSTLHASAGPFTIGHGPIYATASLDADFAFAFVAAQALHPDHVADLYHTTRPLFGD